MEKQLLYPIPQEKPKSPVYCQHTLQLFYQWSPISNLT